MNEISKLIKLRISKNARFSKEGGHKWYCEEDIFEEIDKVLEKEIKLIKQCIQYKNIKCENKSCKNKLCPLNENEELF